MKKEDRWVGVIGHFQKDRVGKHGPKPYVEGGFGEPVFKVLVMAAMISEAQTNAWRLSVADVADKNSRLRARGKGKRFSVLQESSSLMLLSNKA